MSQAPETPQENFETVTMCANCPEKGNTSGQISPEMWTLHLSHYVNGQLVGPSGPETVEVLAFADMGSDPNPGEDQHLTEGSGFWLPRSDTGKVAETIRTAEEKGVALEPDVHLIMGEFVCERIKVCTAPIKEEPIEGLPADRDNKPIGRLVCGGYNRQVLLDFLRDRLAKQAENPPAER